MKYKGYELLKAIANGEIKERSRFKAEYKTFIARDGGVRIDIWTHFMRGCIIDYVH